MKSDKKVLKIIQVSILIVFFSAFSSAILINEFVTDPQTDWDNDGAPDSSDEWIEIYNDEQVNISLANWTLLMNDSTSTSQQLNGLLLPGDYKIIFNPAGIINDNGQIILYNSAGDFVDSVTYGNWPDGNISDNAPNGNADERDNECLARIPNGVDTNTDSNDFVKIRCTFGAENGVTPPNEQELNVTIAGKIVFQVTPRNLEFGLVQPNSFNNPALNGPIIFNLTGSTADANVEITQVIGFPFENGLRIDGEQALGRLWEFICQPVSGGCDFDLQTAFPTLDVPLDAPAGNNRGTIVYTIFGNSP